MFLENKYKKIYFKIIDNAKTRVIKSDCFYEKHHIIPKSLGGDYTADDNLVYLTPREHFICHRLLVKFTEGVNKKKMAYALSSFYRNNPHQKRVLTSQQYEAIRKELANSMKGENNPMFTHSIDFSGEKNPFYGKTHTPATRKIISEKNKEWNKTHDNSFKGKTHSKETREYLSKLKSKPILVHFMNGDSINLSFKGELGLYLGKSYALGVKLCRESNCHLWKKYNIKEIELL